MHANIFKQIIVILIKDSKLFIFSGKEGENKQAIVTWITSILFFTC